MSRSQRKNAHNKVCAWGILITVSTVFHFCILHLFLFVYKGNYRCAAFHVSRVFDCHTVPIFVVNYKNEVVVPAVSRSIKPKLGPANNVAKVGTTVQSPSSLPKALPATSVTESVVKKKPEKAQKQKTTTVQPKEPKKEAVAPAASPEKICDTVNIEKKEEKISTVLPQPRVENAIVVSNYREKVKLTKQYAFECQLAEIWRPPVGALGHSCTLGIRIATNGTVANIKTICSSGLIMYDVQARNTVLTIDMPKELWGSVVEITFES
jgi:hypothetical protein